ncbi:MAG TPA: class I SAM-dependent methyltransferase [Acidimicrobiales bacterium]|nr:class I SAM-dependent methyltransferase [Acidimicrobiales bacterium]
MTTQEAGAPVDRLLDELRRRVEERRSAGEYPTELEAELDAHFERIAIQRTPEFDFAVLHELLDGLRKRSAFSVAQIDYSSKFPGGSRFHRLMGRIVGRQVAAVVEQVQQHSDAVLEVVTNLTQALEHPRIHQHPDLAGELILLLDRVAAYERAAASAGGGTVLGDARNAFEDSRAFVPWFSNENFEAAFRGERSEIEERYTSLAREFVDCEGPVYDVGCGRGEFLELLLALGVDATGIEIDTALVASAGERGLPVEFGDLIPWLERRDFAGVAGLSLIQVVEHLPPRDVSRFVALAAAKTKPGGKVVVETVNPQSLYVYAHSFYLDPTHVAPVHPAYLMFLFEEAGFSDVGIMWRSPCPADDVLEELDGDSPQEQRLNENIRRLNRLLFAEQDYAVIATR